MTLEWFRNYLGDRKYFVMINNISSETKVTICGVPWGSAIGPLFFIISSYDVSSILKTTKSKFFADDTTIYYCRRNVNLLFGEMTKDLEKLPDWFRSYNLSLNVRKTNYMLFIPDINNAYNGDQHEITLTDQKIKRVKALNVWVVFLIRFSWTEHIQYCKNKVASGNYSANSMKNILATKILTTIYTSLVQSFLTYGLLVWDAAAKTTMKPQI